MIKDLGSGGDLATDIILGEFKNESMIRMKHEAGMVIKGDTLGYGKVLRNYSSALAKFSYLIIILQGSIPAASSTARRVHRYRCLETSTCSSVLFNTKSLCIF